MLRSRFTKPSTLRYWQVILFLTILCATAFTKAQADDDELLQQVHQFLYEETRALGEEVVIDLRPPSPHLPECVQPEPFLPNANQAPLGRVSVGVRCGEDSRQVRYLQAQVDVIGNYVVAARDIERGTLITSSMLSELGGNLGDLSAHYLQAPHLVERGQRVTVVAEGSAFRVSREGEALENGALGDRIRVRFGSREIMTARVTDRGILVVDF